MWKHHLYTYYEDFSVLSTGACYKVNDLVHLLGEQVITSTAELVHLATINEYLFNLILENNLDDFSFCNYISNL